MESRGRVKNTEILARNSAEARLKLGLRLRLGLDLRLGLGLEVRIKLAKKKITQKKFRGFRRPKSRTAVCCYVVCRLDLSIALTDLHDAVVAMPKLCKEERKGSTPDDSAGPRILLEDAFV